MGTVLCLREPIRLGLDQSLLFIFIVNFTIIAFRVGEHVAVIIDIRTSIGEPNGLIPFITVRSGLRVNSLTELVIKSQPAMSMPDKGDSQLTRENGAHWVTAHAIPVRVTSTVAPKVLVMKLEVETPSSSMVGPHSKRELTTY